MNTLSQAQTIEEGLLAIIDGQTGLGQVNFVGHTLLAVTRGTRFSIYTGPGFEVSRLNGQTLRVSGYIPDLLLGQTLPPGRHKTFHPAV